MNRLSFLLIYLMCLSSCSNLNNASVQNMDFNPISVSAKWRYSYSHNFGSSLYSRQESGYREIKIESEDSYRDSNVYTATVSDSVDQKIEYSLVNSAPTVTTPFMHRYTIFIIEYKNGKMRVVNDGKENTIDAMLAHAFRSKSYPDSMITLDTINGGPVYSVTFTQSGSSVYFNDIGMKSFYYHGCSGGQVCPLMYDLIEYQINNQNRVVSFANTLKR